MLPKLKRNGKPVFAIIGLGFISSKHFEAIEKVGGGIWVVCDSDLNL